MKAMRILMKLALVLLPFAVWAHPAVGAAPNLVQAGGQAAAPGRGGAPAAAPAPMSTLTLPGHRYDLPATHITAAQIQQQKTKQLADKRDDVPITMVKMGGGSDKHQVGVSLVYREPGVVNNFAVHDDVAEVYYIIQGSGSMMLGGTITDAVRRRPSAGNGMGISGTMAAGAKEVNLAQGDVLIIPAGTPHKFKAANEFTLYTVVRVDPDGVAQVQ